MSRQNKVNRDSYTQAGRLTPDDMARERQKQMKAATDAGKERITNRSADQSRCDRAGRVSSPPQSEPEE